MYNSIEESPGRGLNVQERTIEQFERSINESALREQDSDIERAIQEMGVADMRRILLEHSSWLPSLARAIHDEFVDYREWVDELPPLVQWPSPSREETVEIFLSPRPRSRRKQLEDERLEARG